VLPNIQAVLLPKKTESHHKTKGKWESALICSKDQTKGSFQGHPYFLKKNLTFVFYWRGGEKRQEKPLVYILALRAEC
jgi:hypothetical protein